MNVLEAAVANMREAYLRLADTVPGSRRLVDPDFQGAAGPFPHPISNFAIELRVNPESLRRLADLARIQPRFTIYHTDVDRPDCAEESLRRSGWRAEFGLDVLAAAVTPPPASIAPILAQTIGDRHRVVAFMAQQFFRRLDRETRNQLVASTALSIGPSLWALEDRDLRAAMMTFEDEATLGLYNLCVAPDRRGRGVGSEMVRHFMGLAAADGKIATLQCRPELTPWYERFGFERIGMVEGRFHNPDASL